MENKHKINLFKGIFLILLFTFTTLYIASYNGYYEYSNNKKVTLTNEKIKEFEEDVKNGKKIDLENNKEINIIFDTAESTDVMKEVINELTKYYIEDILKIHI